MKTKIVGIKMLAQCPLCQTIKMDTGDKKRPIAWQMSIVTFDYLPKETCVACRQKL